MITDMNLYKAKQAPRTWTKAELEQCWSNTALLFLGEEGIPAIDALGLFGGDALAMACKICPGAFDILGDCFYLTKRGAEAAAAVCNLNFCGDEYGADALEQDLAGMGLSLPDPPKHEESTGYQQGGRHRGKGVHAAHRRGLPEKYLTPRRGKEF